MYNSGEMLAFSRDESFENYVRDLQGIPGAVIKRTRLVDLKSRYGNDYQSYQDNLSCGHSPMSQSVPKTPLQLNDTPGDISVHTYTCGNGTNMSTYQNDSDCIPDTITTSSVKQGGQDKVDDIPSRGGGQDKVDEITSHQGTREMSLADNTYLSSMDLKGLVKLYTLLRHDVADDAYPTSTPHIFSEEEWATVVPHLKGKNEKKMKLDTLHQFIEYVISQRRYFEAIHGDIKHKTEKYTQYLECMLDGQ